MKKIILTISLLTFIMIGFLLSPSYQKVEAQNIGTLRNIVTPGFSFKKDLRLGDTDPDVRELQRVLNADIDTMINTTEAGGRGRETTYFGALTKEAIVRFQNKYKDIVLTLNSITVADGVVNKATRTRLNLLLGVMNTYDSVGSPQGRAGTGTAVVVPPPTPTPVPTPAVTGPSMSICQFVELLINIQAISPIKAPQARSAMNCPSAIAPFVDIKVNNSNGPVTVAKKSNVTVSWTTGGVVSCSTGGASRNKTLTGSERYTMGDVSEMFTLICKTASGATVSDSVTVRISSANDDDTDTDTEPISPSLLSTTNYSFGYSLAIFNIKTNIPTKAYITYWTNSSDKKTASFTELKSSRAETITGLTPDTLYYFTIKVVSAENKEFVSREDSARTGKATSNNTYPTNFPLNRGINIYVNGETNYTYPEFYPVISEDLVLDINPMVTWSSSGYGSCKISSSPKVTDLYEATTTLSGSSFPSLSPQDYEGETTFSLICATGTATTTLSKNTVKDLLASTTVLTASSTWGIATSTMKVPKVIIEPLTPAEIVEPLDIASKTDVSGIVTRVTKCLTTNGPFDLTEVEIQPCNNAQNVSRYVPDATGTLQFSGNFTGNIFITLRNNIHDIPKVGDNIIARVVPAGDGKCLSLAGEVPPSAYKYEGIISGVYSHAPDQTGQCVLEGGGSGSSNFFDRIGREISSWF